MKAVAAHVANGTQPAVLVAGGHALRRIRYRLSHIVELGADRAGLIEGYPVFQVLLQIAPFRRRLYLANRPGATQGSRMASQNPGSQCMSRGEIGRQNVDPLLASKLSAVWLLPFEGLGARRAWFILLAGAIRG